MADGCIPSFSWFQHLTAKSFLALQLGRLGHRRMSHSCLAKPKSKPRANIAACRSRIPLTPSTAPTLRFPLHRANSFLGSAEANLDRSSRDHADLIARSLLSASLPRLLREPGGEPVRINRHTTAKILGLTIRQLQRWHNR